ncbi:DHBP synthase RibB-like alpha/beta domain-containing protein [Pholiota molesta]|nr:DHBP synthase RibB-like alpha/beta domain-containing protein [Pholiota molesta]
MLKSLSSTSPSQPSLALPMAPVAIASSPMSHSSAPTNGISKPAQTSTWRPTQVANPPARTAFAFDTMEDALAAFAAGEFLVVMDDENRENEGDLIISGSQCTTEKMAWMIKHTSLDIPMMVPDNQNDTAQHSRSAYAIATSYLTNLIILIGTTTGISAHDRSLTARALASPTATADDFTRPGHMVPLRAREGGVLTRKGHTESGPPAGVLCELVNDDAQGTMARRDDCRAFADRWGLKMISVEMLAQYKRLHSQPS